MYKSIHSVSVLFVVSCMYACMWVCVCVCLCIKQIACFCPKWEGATNAAYRNGTI